MRDGVSGFLVNGHDPADYADRLLELLADPAEGRRMGQRGIAHSLRFSWDATASEILSVYTSLRGGVAGSRARGAAS